jgi:hypothetical protein
VVAKLLVRLALCAATTWLIWRYLGLLGAVSTIPLYAAALASPILELLAGTHRAAKELVLADVQGRYYQHRGHAIDVRQDDEEQLWLLVRDVRRVLPALPRDEVLARLFPGSAQPLPPARELRIRADALVEHLRSAQDPGGVKFKVWLQRELLHEARGR